MQDKCSRLFSTADVTFRFTCTKTQPTSVTFQGHIAEHGPRGGIICTVGCPPPSSMGPFDVVQLFYCFKIGV